MLVLRASSLSSALLIALFCAGCATNVDEPATPEASTSALSAIVSVESTSYADEIAAAHATAVARFIRSQDGLVDAPTLEMLGASIDLPPSGHCTASMPSAEGARAVDLVDFGAVSIETAGKATPLMARRVPDVTDLISGVVYAARLEGEDAPTSGPLSIRIDAENGEGPFTVDVAQVSAPANVAFDGTPFDAAAPLRISAAMDLLVTWSAEPGDDIVYFEIRGGGGESATCAYEDLGTATLPSALFARAGGSLVVHRLHREAISAHGIDDGEARFDFSRVYSFTTADLSP